jgi:hypothetical protein
MSDAPEVNFEANEPAAGKNKKARKPPRRASFQKPDNKPAAPFPGLTRTACATACTAAGCVISGKPYCAHPTKGGLQTTDMGNPAALKRLQDARNQIDVRLDPDRFK